MKQKTRKQLIRSCIVQSVAILILLGSISFLMWREFAECVEHGWEIGIFLYAVVAFALTATTIVIIIMEVEELIRELRKEDQ